MKILIFLAGINLVLANHGFGPWVQGSRGKIWPKPQLQRDFPSIYSINPQLFKFKIVEGESELINKAIKRISARLFKDGNENLHKPSPLTNYIHYEGDLPEVELITYHLKKDKYPVMDMDEHYEIKINAPDTPGVGQIIAMSPWGIIRGLESFTHLVYFEKGKYFVNSTMVMDFPRFPYRGLMLDTSRHFLPVDIILETLDLMEMNKYNVLHWHMTDDPSFPFQSLIYPDLSIKGSYSKEAVYSHGNISLIIEEARVRGIRVIPEFDTPGHTASWGQGMPDIMTSCPNAPSHGPALNPIKDSVYKFLKVLFKEIMGLFPDKFLHLGGDEVDKTCWKNNQAIVEFMKQKNWTNYNKLEELYINKFTDILMTLDSNTVPIVWEEIVDDGAVLENRTILQVWKGGWQETTKGITAKGYKVILSSPFYLNYLSYGIDWPKYYKVDPTDFGGDEQQQKMVLGGETCLWGEFINKFNLINIGWPRSSAVAERLWSSQGATDVEDAAKRLEEHTCRMIKRGHRLAPANGPNYC